MSFTPHLPPPRLYLFIFLMWVLWVQYRFLPCITKCTCFKGGWGSDPRYTHMNTCCHQQHHHPHLFRANKPSCFINPPSLIKNQPHFSQSPPPFSCIVWGKSIGLPRGLRPPLLFSPGADGIQCHEILIIFSFFSFIP